MEEKTEAGYAGLFRGPFAEKNYRAFLPKSNCHAGLVFFLKRSNQKKGQNIIIWIKLIYSILCIRVEFGKSNINRKKREALAEKKKMGGMGGSIPLLQRLFFYLYLMI